MATGFILEKILAGKKRHYKAALAGLLLALGAASCGATEVGLAGILGQKAILIIDGASPRTLAVGQQHAGVKLLSVQENGVQVEIDGKRLSLRVGQNAVGGASAGGQDATVTLTADSKGHFNPSGMINGRSVNFTVDTGASLISMSMSDAKRLGLNLERGTPSMFSTANGSAQGIILKLDTVSVGGITLRNVDAAVMSHNVIPRILLGNSFLNRTNMQRNGDTLILKQRY
ncbi:MAG: TIGR02281 family clan AA aspartic protease [Zoogloeaceae bacterium]|jgi:aspartyl protease family protein|nr:TIGR02281 family clan AA aspartic protease [Zoogloeaceae bacterium]